MLRTANQRRNQILEAQLRVRLTRDELTAEGHFMRRVHDLKLCAAKSAIRCPGRRCIRLTSTVPYGVTAETLAAAEATIIVTLSGIDETVSQTLHARHIYARTRFCGTCVLRIS